MAIIGDFPDCIVRYSEFRRPGGSPAVDIIGLFLARRCRTQLDSTMETIESEVAQDTCIDIKK